MQLDGIDDPTELLSYLGPSADTNGAGIGGSSNADDLLSLFTQDSRAQNNKMQLVTAFGGDFTVYTKSLDFRRAADRRQRKAGVEMTQLHSDLC